MDFSIKVEPVPQLAKDTGDDRHRLLESETTVTVPGVSSVSQTIGRAWSRRHDTRGASWHCTVACQLPTATKTKQARQVESSVAADLPLSQLESKVSKDNSITANTTLCRMSGCAKTATKFCCMCRGFYVRCSLVVHGDGRHRGTVFTSVYVCLYFGFNTARITKLDKQNVPQWVMETHLFWNQKIKSQGHYSQKTLPAWFFALLWVLAFSSSLLGPLWVLSQPCRSCSCVVSCHVFMRLFYEQMNEWMSYTLVPTDNLILLTNSVNPVCEELSIKHNRRDGVETICSRRWPFRSFPAIKP